MKNLLMLSTMMLMLIVTSCSKDQKAVKTLDGTWKLTKIDNNAVATNLDYKLTFTKCKLKSDETCPFKSDFANGGPTVSTTGTFLVSDEGTTLETRVEQLGQTVIKKYKITELSKSTLILEITEGATVTKNEFAKQ